MAIAHLTNGKKMYLPPDKALNLWRILNGEVEPTKEQEAFATRVEKLYLNRHTAPQSYLDKHHDILKQMPSL